MSCESETTLCGRTLPVATSTPMKQHSQRNSIVKKDRSCSSSNDFLLEIVSRAGFYACWPAIVPRLTDWALKVLTVPDSLQKA